MSNTIEQLELEISANSKGAVDGIDALTQSLEKLKSATKGGLGLSAVAKEIGKVDKATKRTSATNNNAGKSFTDLFYKVKTGIRTFELLGDKIWSSIEKSNDYVENLNLFTVSMGDYADEAMGYAETVSDAMGIDTSEWIRAQGVFMTMAEGFGVASDRAATMSKNLTQLGYDLSSFYNIDIETAMLKLKSGLAGELEPLRAIGYDLSQAKLEATAAALGITKSVSAMTQAEKAQLRYYAIMTQVTVAQGDMARTLDDPANQLRVLKAQLSMAAREIGNVFIPALNAILPYAIAAVKVIGALAKVIAGLFGYEAPQIEDSIAGAGESAGEVADGLGDAQKEAKKLKSYMMGFDELNVINPNSGSESDGAGEFDFKLPEYDFMSGLVESKVAEIVEDMKEWLGLTEDIDTWSELLDTRFGDILTTAGLIGAAIAAWKVTQTFLDAIALLKSLLANPTYAIAISVVVTITGIKIAVDGMTDAIENGLDGFNFGEIIGGSLLGTGGVAILGTKIASWILTAFEGSKVATALTTAAINLFGSTGGVITAEAVAATGGVLAASVAGIIAGIPMFIIGIYDAIKNGIDWLSSILIPAGATAAGAGIGAIVGAAGGPLTAGIGALIGVAVGLITDLIILIVQNWEEISTWCKNACAAIGQFFVDLWDGIVAVWNAVAEWFNTWVITPLVDFFTGLWDGIKELAKSCWEGIVEFFTPAITWFAELFGSIWQTISDVFYNIGVIAGGCWDIIKAVWEIVATWFNDTVVTPVVGFFEGLWTSVSGFFSSLWNDIKIIWKKVSKWFDDNVVTPVKDAFTGVWNALKEGAEKAWEGITEVFNKVASFFKDTFKTAWEGVKKVFEVGGKIFDGIKDGIVSAFTTVVNAIIKGINKVVAVPFNGINSALSWLRDLEIVGITPFKNLTTISVPEIPLLASGGFPDQGQMFIAREAGPEMVGSIGRRTAVVNNEQIVSGIAGGVAQANEEQNMLLREQNSLLRALLEKDSGVYLDGKNLTDSVEKYQRERGRVLIAGGVV